MFVNPSKRIADQSPTTPQVDNQGMNFGVNPKNFVKFCKVGKQINELIALRDQEKLAGHTDKVKDLDRKIYHLTAEREEFKTAIYHRSRFLVPARNTTKLEAHSNQTDYQQAAVDLKDHLIAHENLYIKDLDLSEVEINGICRGASIDFAKVATLLMEAELSPQEFKNQLIQLANEFEPGGGPTAVANQIVYQKLKETEQFTLLEEITNSVTKNSQNYTPYQKELAKSMFLHFKIDNKLVSKEEGAIAQEKVKACITGLRGTKTDSEYLRNLSSLEDGVYDFATKVGEENSHASVYIRYKGNGFLWEPNYGLLECHPNDHAKVILKILKKYDPPPPTQIQAKPKESHHIQIMRYSLIK